MKTGFYPMIVKLKLFFKWGISFGKEYTVSDKGNRKVEYAGKDILQDQIFIKYNSKTQQDEAENSTDSTSSNDHSGGGQRQCQTNQPQTKPPIRTQRPSGGD